MASINATPYQNPTRIVTGSVAVDNDDLALYCDTSTGAVNIGLLSIPANAWNTLYKLYIVDISNNAATNNIIITPAAGQTINGASSITINANGGAALLQIGSNIGYFATYYPLQTGGTVTSITALPPLTGGTIINSGNIGWSDTGWINCDGFDFMAGSSERPQFRIYGNQVFLRGTAIVPLANAGVFIPMVTTGLAGSYYVNEQFASPFTSTSGSVLGVTALGSGSLVFALGTDIIPATFVGTKQFTEFYSQMVVGARPIATNGTGTYIYLTGQYVIRFGKGSLSTLRVDSIREYEDGSYDLSGGITPGSVGTSNLRQIVGSVKASQYAPNYQRMLLGVDATSSSSSTTSFPQNYDIFIDPSTSNPTDFFFDVDSSRAADMGGFQFRLDGITTFLD
jgi:hypothetical protein